jgi:hypothetical protein
LWSARARGAAGVAGLLASQYRSINGPLRSQSHVNVKAKSGSPHSEPPPYQRRRIKIAATAQRQSAKSTFISMWIRREHIALSPSDHAGAILSGCVSRPIERISRRSWVHRPTIGVRIAASGAHVAPVASAPGQSAESVSAASPRHRLRRIQLSSDCESEIRWGRNVEDIG